MNAERLLELYDRVSEAPDAIPRLRRFISDLAVRGKLVDQDPDDEPASELLKRIAVHRLELVQAGEAKAQKHVPAATRQDLSFDLPSTWEPARLADVAVCLDYMRRPINGSERAKRIEGKSETELYPYYGATQQQGWIDDYIFDDELVLLGEDGVPFFDPMRAKAYLISGKSWVNNHAHVFKGLLISSPFLVQYLNVFDYTGRVVGATRSKLNQARAIDIPIPLPPVAEQHRIVAKVDELMALCDSLEAERETREATRDRLTTASLSRLTATDVDEKQFKAHADFAIKVLPELTTRSDQIKVLRQTILDLAVRGKLVEQDPNDEPASESLARLLDQKRAAHLEEGLRQRPPVAKPTRLDLTFEFPVSWDLTCFDDVFVVVSGITKGQRVNPQDAVEVPYLRVANVQRGYLDLAIVKSISVKEIDVQRYQLRNGDILMTEGGDWDKLGRAAIWQEEISHCIHQNHIFRLRPPSTDILPEWVVAYANSPSGRSFFEGASKQTTNLASINMTQLRGCPLPLPPLAEQYRIVTKVNQLMMFCEQIEKARTTESNRQIELLEALLLETMQPMVQRAAS